MILENLQEVKDIIRINCTKLSVYDKTDKYLGYLNAPFVNFFDDMVYYRKYIPMYSTRSEIRVSCRKLNKIGYNIPRFCKNIKLDTFIFILETNKYVVPVLFLYDTQYNQIISGYTLVEKSSNKNLVLKCLGINKNYPHRLIKDINDAIRKSIS